MQCTSETDYKFKTRKGKLSQKTNYLINNKDFYVFRILFKGEKNENICKKKMK